MLLKFVVTDPAGTLEKALDLPVISQPSLYDGVSLGR